MSGTSSATVTPTGDTVRIVQLTDAHLCRENGGTLLDMDTDHSLGVVIERVRREREGLDILLGTGDLADSGAPEAYQRLNTYFNELHENNYWLPGNHDDRSAMEAVGGPDRLPGTIRSGNWLLVMLDSQVPGEVGGELGAKELAHLRTSLEEAAAAGEHVLICLHHQPVTIGCGWLDEQMVADADEFFAVVDDFECVRGILWGHVHQELDTLRNGVRLLASPSTCVQFAPGCENFKADDKPPGYRWLDLTPDGGIATGVSRVLGVTFEVDLESGGYL